MAAESSFKSNKYLGQAVCPESVADKTLIESVAGLIQDVAPLAYPSTFNFEGKDSIQWIRFENHIDGGTASDECSRNCSLLLIIGYQSGIQVFSVLPSGDAQEIFNWRSGSVKTLQVLPNPEGCNDLFKSKRPLIVLCDDSGSGPLFTSVSVVSLKTGEQIKTIKFKSPVCEILCNKSIVVCTFVEKIAAFDSCTFEDKFTITCCYPNPNCNPVALGNRWLAFCDSHLNVNSQSSGGVMSGVSSYKTSVFNAARSLTKGLKEFSETVANSLTGSRSIQSSNHIPLNQPTPGIITVIDVKGVSKGEIRVQENASGIVAHFMAHYTHPIYFVMFDPSGMLLFSSDKLGNSFHIFKIFPHPGKSCLGAVHHLYVLHRGDTTAKIQNVAFTSDSRWIAVCTSRGTTHVFPINPYGGSVNKRTHTSYKVVNKLSTFHRSAGFDESNSKLESSNLSSSPIQSRMFDCMLSCPYPNPRLMNIPPPIIVHSVVRIRKPFSSLSSGSNATHKNSCQRSPRNISGDDNITLKVAAMFSSPRACLMNTSHVLRDRKDKHVVDALLIMTSQGYLLEYCLEPRADSSIPKEKLGEDSPIEVFTSLLAQWNFTSPKFTQELQCPVPETNMNLLNNSKPYIINSKLQFSEDDKDGDLWLAQVEIETHCGPYRRLWMGPQFVFKTYNESSVIDESMSELHSCEYPMKSRPLKMPSGQYWNASVIESGSFDHSPRYAELCGDHCYSDGSGSDVMEDKIEENIADAMKESTNECKNEGTVIHQIIFPCDNTSQESIEEIFPLAMVSRNRSSSGLLGSKKDSEISFFSYKSSECESPAESYITCPSSHIHEHPVEIESFLEGTDLTDPLVNETLASKSISIIDTSPLEDSVFLQTDTTPNDARKQSKKKNKKRRK